MKELKDKMLTRAHIIKTVDGKDTPVGLDILKTDYKNNHNKLLEDLQDCCDYCISCNFPYTLYSDVENAYWLLNDELEENDKKENKK